MKFNDADKNRQLLLENISSMIAVGFDCQSDSRRSFCWRTGVKKDMEEIYEIETRIRKNKNTHS